ncbi:MAG: DNA-3-methyladenine glycosylase I [Alphaproteobacteria bacterium]|nr:DNA-3-methyladenine glycosylase I [Alphaproteobacteria bacterium]
MSATERCPWPGHDPLYVSYHDDEWGVPEFDHRALYEKLILDGFQAGLSWITILRKRQAFREAFDGFNPEKIARYTDKKVEKLLANAGIIRHRGKIEGAVKNARAYLEIMEKEPGGFSAFVWSHVDGRPLQNAIKSIAEAPTESPMSQKLSKALKARGFVFCGPTIIYAYAQAIGMVNDHLVTCFRHEACAALAKGLGPNR